ncbi:L-erythro-3,5-diaminohexanoate dehydrogenase [Polyangium jinanense]|uniref:L-erythro-3,5-diaminohexanoate dehydrogenase n=1 Tax=Polyangium jinanense TaxID=2829994 RepID=A0A9X4AVB7_9BACT|nr:L-erythro-3,5-diaminohexanoate dehydrogenase [Polyangium jinanense]MDC3959690.1 L-erythro-3,5-diaminohexanoate dehydrogenase [Polyangium jinanense]MDC3984142.1 L-erythro-3,5-diaminohexanoate dehydrogenase [Polyangium jinanense]
MTTLAGDPLGTHRVLAPKGALPQPAERLDNDLSKVYATEIVVDVQTLNVDAASFRQMEEASGGNPDGVAALVLETVKRRGKQHNPVTGSGGMLLGVVERVGDLAAARGFVPGDRVATLISLSLTPLWLDRVLAVRPASAQLDVVGKAAVFLTAPIARIPTDMPERLVLALLDVAGAAPQVARLCGPGDSVVVLGAGGKSGLLCAAEARRRVGDTGKVIGIESFPAYADDLRALGICDHVATLDARDPLAVRDAVAPLTEGRGADLVLSCVNVPGVELAAILAARDRGKVYYFAMSTSFTAAALGAEGIGRDVDLFIGNGYAHDHAEHTLSLVRGSRPLHDLMQRRYT